MSFTSPNIVSTTIIATALLTAACSEIATHHIDQPVAKTANINSQYCYAGAENTTLDLTGVTLKREANIPLMYQGFNNIEGPVWHDGALYYSNMGSHQADETGFVLTNQTTIWRWVMGEEPQIWMPDTTAGTNGLALDSAGNLVVGRQLDGSVSYIDWQTQQVTPIVNSYQGKRFNSPNDLIISHNDTIYFTDPNWNTPSSITPSDTQGGGQPGSLEEGQRIYRASIDGQVNATAVTTLVPDLSDKPNGIMLSLDEKQLIVGGLRGLWAFDLDEKGEVFNPRQLLDSKIDGMGKDCAGNIYATTTRQLPERADGQVVVVLDKNFTEVGMLKVPGIHIVTNVAFGGDDGKTLFVTSLTAPMDGNKPRQCGSSTCLQAGIYTAKLNVPGFPY